jgi:hypothetical protein
LEQTIERSSRASPYLARCSTTICSYPGQFSTRRSRSGAQRYWISCVRGRCTSQSTRRRCGSELTRSETQSVWRRLPYAPAQPITAASTDDDIRRFVSDALELQAEAGVSAYLTPCLPLDSAEALVTNRRLAFAARDAVGVDVDRRPLICAVAPSTRLLHDVRSVVEMLADVPVDEIHVQPLRFRPTELSLATLDRYCDYLSGIQIELGVPTSAGRVGAFGLVLLAVGVGAFDSGLTTAEAFDLNGAVRAARRRRERREDGEEPQGGRKRRFYLTQLKTTVLAPVMDIIDTPQLRYRFTSSLPCRAASGFGGYVDHAREHCLFARTEESRKLLREPLALRAAVLAAQLADARDTAAVLTRALVASQIDAPTFDHLERWRRLVLARAERVQAARKSRVNRSRGA